MICSQEVSAGTGEGKKRATLEWRLAAGQGRGGWEFLLLKLTHPSQEKPGTREEPDKGARFLMPQDLRNQPQKDCSWACHSATLTRTCTWRRRL